MKLRDFDHVKELVRSEARLEDVARHYGVDLRNAGADNVKACCPFHEEDTPSFGISLSKQVYFCFGCKEQGDVFTFVMKQETCPFGEAIQKVAEIAGFDLTPYRVAATDEDRRLAQLYAANQTVLEWAAAPPATWVKKRRLDKATLAEYGIGYAAITPGMAADESAALGFDRAAQWRDAIVVPLRDASGRVCGFRNRPMDGNPKVIGPKEKEHALPIPQVYGLWEARKAIRRAGYAILVEGEADVWQMAAAGFDNVVGMIGTKLNDEMLDYLSSVGVSRLVVMPDGDKAGREFALRLSQQYRGRLVLKIAYLLDGDPDEVLRRDGPQAIQDALDKARYHFQYLIDTTLDICGVETPTDRMDALQDLREYVGRMAPAEQALAVDYLAKRLDMARDGLADFFREGVAEQGAALHNLAGERVVLRAMLSDLEFAGRAILALRGPDFYLDKHRVAFEVMSGLYRSQQPVSEDTVATTLTNKGATTVAQFVRTLASSEYAGVEQAAFFLDDISDKATRRQVQRLAREVVSRVSNADQDARGIVSVLTQDLANLVVGGGDKLHDVGTLVEQQVRAMHERMRNPNAIIGLDLGSDWTRINHALHGLQKGRYFVLAAPSGVGKTTIATAWARRAAFELSEPTLFCTYETGPQSITDRLISSISGVEHEKILTGFIDAEEAEIVQDSAAALAAAPLVITGQGRTFEEFQAVVRHDHLRRGTRIVIADYIQLMNMQRNAGINRYTELGSISRGMLELAQDLMITLVVVAQINRDGTKRGRPSKEDIGDSYKIVQDCDGFLVAWNKSDEEVEADGGIEKGGIGFLLDKHRHGRDNVYSGVVADMSCYRVSEAH